MDKNQVGLSGEFYALAQLTARGMIATLTLGNTKGVDILVTNQDIDKLFKVEVKTTSIKPRVEKLFGDQPSYHWPMSKKHESMKGVNLIYCFVVMESEDKLPLFFLVPAEKVAHYVKWQHDYWLSTRVREVNPTTMRTFRIETHDPDGYLNNWEIFK